MLAIFTVLNIMGCDINEGPREEAREAVRAAERGAPADEVREEMREVRLGRVESREEADRQLRKMEGWVERNRREMRQEGREVSQDADRQFDKIEAELAELRADFNELDDEGSGWDRFKDRFNNSMRNIAIQVDKIDGEVDDKPGDEAGPG
jgi:chromosome segregation ATPase